MVQATVMRRGLALFAVVYLLMMVYPEFLSAPLGHSPRPKSTPRFGLLDTAPESINAIELQDNGVSYRVEKANERWHYRHSMLSGDMAHMITELCKMLTAAEPVRTFLPEDLQSVKERDYGFDEINLSFRIGQITDAPEAVLRFGSATPDGGLHYVRKDDDPNLYVMSGFLYQHTRALLNQLKAKRQHGDHEHLP
ncbi:MAG: DUF4340 domain-containing protein [Gammaproteobacteria bacterium]